MTNALARLIGIKPSEVIPALWAFFGFFSLMSGYYVLKPLREEIGVTGGVEHLQWLFWATFGAMAVASVAFAALVSRLPRSRFIPLTFRFFAVNLLLFVGAVYALPAEAEIWIGRLFFVWVSVFNLFVVSVFWSFLADAFALRESKRLFGFFAAGASLGGIAGSRLTADLVNIVPIQAMPLLTVVLLEAALLSFRRLGAGRGEHVESAPGTRQGAIAFIGRTLEGAGLIARSPYLLMICAYILLYTTTSTFLYFQQAYIVDGATEMREARAQIFANIYFLTNVLSLLVQLFVAGRLMSGLGVGLTLSLLPIITTAGFIALAGSPVLAMLVPIVVLRSASNYALAKPARETLFTVVSRSEKYKSKNFIDTVVYRGGDAVSASAYDGLAERGFSLSQLAWIAAPIGVLWLVIAVVLGRRQQRRSAADAGDVDHRQESIPVTAP